jgi:CubicO group peptidase (beta-lactamase class C family)
VADRRQGGRPAIDYARPDEILQAFVDSPDGPLGASYGILRGGELLHCNGFGRVSLTGAAPTSDSMFRIASVSKSFTAAAVLLLRDRGRLQLTDPVAEYLPPEFQISGMGPDFPAISIQSCLTMSAGLPTDDPWADRQESMSRDDFDALLRDGIRLVRPPDTEFEYSNLGYTILGRVIETVTNESFHSFVVENLLRPLGLTATTYDYRDVPDEMLVRGYRRRHDEWIEQPFSAPGAFSALGGLLSSVRELATWVGGMLDAFTINDTSGSNHPLSRAARLEMQQGRRAIPPEIHVDEFGVLSELRSKGFAWGLAGYGYGLFVEQDPRWGEMVHHVGGYPGFSAHVRWHPSSGYGIVALTNRRYSPVWVPAAEALRTVLTQTQARAKVITLWPEVLRARSQIVEILRLDDAADIARSFEPPSAPPEESEAVAMSANVCADVPADERADEVVEIQRLVGKPVPHGIVDVESDSPAHVVWWQEAGRGSIRGEIRLTPTRVPLIQTVALSAVPRPAPLLGQAVGLLRASVAEGSWAWPEDISTTDPGDPSRHTRRLEDARRLVGTVCTGWTVLAASSTAVEVGLVGDRGRATLRLTTNAAETAIESFSVQAMPASVGTHTVVEPMLPTRTSPPG